MTTRVAPFLALIGMLEGCAVDTFDFDEIGEDEEPLTETSTIAVVPVPVNLDSCDEPDYAAAVWSSATSQHLIAYYLSGTAAERDITGVLARREAAYASIRTALGVTEEPTISIHLSPSRLAAAANGRAFGKAWPGEDRYEVIYTGAPGSYEMTRIGHEMTHVLEYYIDPANPKRIPMLTEGLAEYLDQSGRDMHDAYAQQLLAGTETRIYFAAFESTDVNGKNYGRAGSLVQFLVERYGMATFLDIFKATRVTWTKGCWTSPIHGCIGSASALTSMLDGVLRSVTGEGWTDVRPAWEADVKASLAGVRASVSIADRDEIRNLIANMDAAIVAADPAMYRTTMEGFYCEWGGEALRNEIASRVIAAFAGTTSAVLRIYPTGTKNFPSARAIVRRADERMVISILNLSLEKFPEGWRITYGPDWW